MSTASYETPRAPSVSRPPLAMTSVIGSRWLLPAVPIPDITASSGDTRDLAVIKVLVADDRAGTAASIEHRLSLPTVALVGAATHHRQLAELAALHRPAVVVISFGLALKTGLAQVSRTLAQLCGARLLVLTPHSDHAFGEHIAASGAAGFLHEEAHPDVLAAAINAVHVGEGFFPCGYGRPAASKKSPAAHHPARQKNRSELTAREREVLQHIAEGCANKQTAAKLGISIKTVEKHRQRLMDKLCIHETATLTRYALYAGIAR